MIFLFSDLESGTETDGEGGPSTLDDDGNRMYNGIVISKGGTVNSCNVKPHTLFRFEANKQGYQT